MVLHGIYQGCSVRFWEQGFNKATRSPHGEGGASLTGPFFVRGTVKVLEPSNCLKGSMSIFGERALGLLPPSKLSN